MKDEKYNGWTNYETWAVKLWMDNDEGSYLYWKERAQETFDNAKAGDAYATQTREQAATYELSEQLKDEHNDNNPCEESNNVYTDLMRAALDSVNWYEIAESLLEDVEK